MNANAPLEGRGLALPFTKAANPEADLSDKQLRMPFLHRVPDAYRNHFIAMCGEFVGTVLFLFFALSGAQVANSIPSSAGLTVEQTGSNPQQLQYIALSFGFSLAVNAWVFFRISGGLFNPAVTVGMCLIGALPWVRGVLLFITQLIGGLAAAALVSCVFPGGLNVQTTLGGGTSVVRGLFIEMFLTAQLVFTIFMLAAEKHKGTFIAPVGIGLSLFVAELTGVYFTGGSLNPARSFGPAVVNHNFHGYHWIYWLGPILGAIVAAGFYKFIKILEYETANPDQDVDHKVLVEKKTNLLMAAGINEADARHVAGKLTAQEANQRTQVSRANSGMPVAAGEKTVQDGPAAVNGTMPRSGAIDPTARQSLASDSTYVQPAGANGGVQQPGQYAYLWQAAPANESRVDSPGMTTNEELYSSLDAGGDAPLGDMVGRAAETRQQMVRTASQMV